MGEFIHGEGFIKDVSNTIDQKKLQSLPDESKTVQAGDIVIAVFFMGGADIQEFKLFTQDPIEDDDRGLGNSDKDTNYSIYFADHVVKKESYELN